MVDTFGGKTATAILQIEGIQDSLKNATTFEEQLKIIGDYVCKPGVEIEGKDKILDTIDSILKKLKETDGKEGTAKVKVDADTSEAEKAKKEVDNLAVNKMVQLLY